MIGRKIGGFVLKYKLGEGGMAEVWYAENEIGKKAAVKILNNDLAHNAQIVERFKNEAMIMVKLDHPNIRQVYDYGEIDGRPTMVQEYLEGEDLKAMLKSGRRFSEPELEKWWNQMASALNFTHSQGIVHRDIKPSNIFIDSKGDVRLLDFGIAKIKEGITMTQTGAMMGTLMYMSPEQVCDSKHIDYRSDLYSLAVSFVHLLSGRAPYDTNSSNDYTIRKGIVEQPLDMTGVPAIWRHFLEPYLAKDPQHRPALVQFGGQQATVTAKPVAENTMHDRSEETFVENAKPSTVANPAPKPAKDKNSRRGLWIGLGVAAVAVVIAIVVLLPKDDNSGGKTISAQSKPSNTLNGHEYVDLGLPSGTKWATCNVGANNPEEYGNYYAWGETRTKGSYSYDNYRWGIRNNYDYIKYGYADNLKTLEANDDAATTNWGHGWHMPTETELQELISNCTYQWTTQNDVKGMLFTGTNGNSIFLPAAGDRFDGELFDAGSGGYYWSGSLCSDTTDYAWLLYFNSGHYFMGGSYRDYGFTVRAVCQSQN